jgi:hypothetical protein
MAKKQESSKHHEAIKNLKVGEYHVVGPVETDSQIKNGSLVARRAANDRVVFYW